MLHCTVIETLGQVGGPVLVGLLYQPGGMHYSIGFMAAITLILITAAFSLHLRPASA